MNSYANFLLATIVKASKKYPNIEQKVVKYLNEVFQKNRKSETSTKRKKWIVLKH